MRTALIGLGRMGIRHAAVLKELQLPLVAISDRDSVACENAGQGLGILPSDQYTSASELLRAVEPELVIIATTAPSHHDLVLEAVACGARKILCEKPMATSLSECESMVRSCQKAGVNLAINHQMRFMEQYTLPRQMVNLDEFGGLSSVIVNAGNFGIAMNGTHYFEMFRFMTDEIPVFVNAWFGDVHLPNPRGIQFSDASGVIRLQTASGKRFYMDCSADQGHGLQVTYNCRYGRITVDELDGSMDYVVRQLAHRDLPTTRYAMPQQRDARSIAPADAVAPTKAVLEALLNGVNYPTGEDGMQAMKILVAAHVSHAQDGLAIDIGKSGLPLNMVLPVA